MDFQPAKKRQKSVESNDTTATVIIDLEDKESILLEEEEEQNNLDQQIENEEKNADNLVIKDLMGSVKPEPQKVKIWLWSEWEREISRVWFNLKVEFIDDKA